MKAGRKPRWRTPEDDYRLKRLRRMGFGQKEIVERMGFSQGTIYAKIKALGLELRNRNVSPDESATMITMRADGKSYGAIAKATGHKRTTVFFHLKRKKGRSQRAKQPATVLPDMQLEEVRLGPGG